MGKSVVKPYIFEFVGSFPREFRVILKGAPLSAEKQQDACTPIIVKAIKVMKEIQFLW
jgi:hypothetical protein